MSDFTPVVHKYTASTMKIIVNVYMVETKNGVVVIDGAIALSDGKAILDIIDNKIKKPIMAVLLTHGHPDHYLGVGNLIKQGQVPVAAMKEAVDQIMERDAEESGPMSAAFGAEYPPEKVFPDRIVHDGETLTFDGVDFTVRDYGPCESVSDSIWMYKTGGVDHVFTGDLIYNHMHLFMKDGFALKWIKSLERLRKEFNHKSVFYPAHGVVCGTEGTFWAEGYIKMYLSTVKELLNGRSALTNEELDILYRRMQSYLPNDDLLELVQYKIEETIDTLSKII